MRYLDPKADLTFKKVFGEQKDIVMHFLNALLPLAEDEKITYIEYQTPEQFPDNPLRKYSIVDVSCKDQHGRQFLVEMQMSWSQEFRQRVMFNASKAYVRQVKKGGEYKLIQPVYSLNIVNAECEEGLPDEYYHHYRMVHVQHTDRVIEGLQLVFIELPKFKPQNLTEEKMRVLWLRYLTEIRDQTTEVSPDLLKVPELEKAVQTIAESAFTEEELAAYEKFLDMMRVERTLELAKAEALEKALEEGMKQGIAQGIEKGIEQGVAQGIAQGREQGIAQGREQGIAQGREEGITQGREEGMQKGIEKGRTDGIIAVAKNLKANGLTVEIIAQSTGLSIEEIEKI